MRAIEAKKGVLKLVHPGRHVETHTDPIIASEVLKRNPRHCVTRPDVFEYPWIVVRPESVLKLGRVFYIVPNLTIYKLIKQTGYNIQASLEQKKPPISYVHWQLLELDSPSKSSAGTTPMHQDHCQSDWKQFQASCEDGSLQEQASGDRFSRSTQFESLADTMVKFWNSYKEFKEISVTGYTSETESVGKKQNLFQASGNDCEKQIATILKPCSRKHDSDRKLLHLKVSFSLSTNYEERRRKVALSRAEFPGLFTY
ncbi:Phototropic-responsive NPH3 family protein [Hibiscus syriacus]|uniref:Phototropic-responsive NPH3 family protein n=1 Tax=Hibiscus syriacus TaxID=106335 RepID=A0A6A2ZLH3_HIBSY|nr:Phototropic-responsive NPH3 family protein [Hibiscus syriacus]